MVSQRHRAMKTPTISYLTDIYFEPEALSVLGELLGRMSVKRPLVVTDRGLAELGMTDRLASSITSIAGGLFRLGFARVRGAKASSPGPESMLGRWPNCLR